LVYRGSVLEIAKEHIIVLTNDCNYLKLRKKGNIEIGKEIMFIDDDIIKDKSRGYRPLLIGIAATIILLVITSLGHLGLNFLGGFETFAIVSLDINPSLEFEIDSDKIVRKVNPLNEDAKTLIDDNMIGITIEDAVNIVIDEAIEKNYLNEVNNTILISDTVIKNKSKDIPNLKKDIIDKIKENEELQDINLVYIKSNNEDLKEARKNKISIGKYEIYKVVSKEKPNISIEEIKDKKISEIVKENENLVKKDKIKIKKIDKEDKSDDKKDREKDRKKDQKKNEKKNEKRNKDNIEKEDKDIENKKDKKEKIEKIKDNEDKHDENKNKAKKEKDEEEVDEEKVDEEDLKKTKYENKKEEKHDNKKLEENNQKKKDEIEKDMDKRDIEKDKMDEEENKSKAHRKDDEKNKENKDSDKKDRDDKKENDKSDESEKDKGKKKTIDTQRIKPGNQ